jgi:hypothetical protein
MKGLLLSGVLCSMALSSFCQVKTEPVATAKQYYLQKSKRQLTSGLIAVGVGLGLFALTATNEQGVDDIGTNIILIGGGGIATITGAVLIISSMGNKAKAKKANAFIGVDKMILAHHSHLQKVYYPRIGIRISR